jgi:hypothetical protein
MSSSWSPRRQRPDDRRQPEPVFKLESLPADLVSAETFRDMLGVSESGLRYLYRSGRIAEPVRLRGRLFWPHDQVRFHVAQYRHRNAQ